jgi:hypothetical protein
VWIFPLGAAAVALAFALLLLRQFLARRRTSQCLWAVALLMFAAASFAVFLGVLGGWSSGGYRVFWLFGAVLNVPFLAAGELDLLVRRRGIATALLLVLLFGAAFALSRVISAHMADMALHRDLPSGNDVFARDRFVLAMARLYSIPAYVVLVGGAVSSAWAMRGRAELRDRFAGTLGIVAGATVVAAGSAFAATGNATGFSLTLALGVAVMFWGFLRASRGSAAVRSRTPPSTGNRPGR